MSQGMLRVDNQVLRQLPLPLAQLYRRCVHATSPHARHSMAWYLWQAGLQLLGSTAAVLYERQGVRQASADQALQALACPSVGHFCRIVRELIPLLARAGQSPFAELDSVYSSVIGEETPALRSMALSMRNHLRETRQQQGDGSSRVTVRELFDDLAAYRNDELGHGAADARSSDFYERMAQTLLGGTLSLWQRLSPLADKRLIYVSDVRVSESGVWQVERSELVGEQPRGLPGLELPKSMADRLPLPKRIYLAPPDDAETVAETIASWTSLHPLLVFGEESQEVFFLRGRHGRASVAFVSFVSGEHARKVVAAEHRELLARVLGIPVAPDQIELWAEKSFGEGSGDSALPQEVNAADHRRQLGEFELVSKLGTGGMGTVYRAWQPSLRRYVAVKRLHRVDDERARVRFQREIRSLGHVDHPNLVKVYSSGTQEGDDYFTMELIPGADLERVMGILQGRSASDITADGWQEAISSARQKALSEEQPLSDSRPDYESEQAQPVRAKVSHDTVRTGRGHIVAVVELMRQVAEAVQTLHEAGVIHRDIKPGNILVTPDGQAVLTDLGLAQMSVEKTITATRQFVGTIRYASPEQVHDSSRVDARSDIYSLGATLWELLTLRPFLGITSELPTPEQFNRVRKIEPESPKKHNPQVAGDLATIVLKCIHKDEDQRYRTAGELSDDLARWLAGEPVTAQPPTLGYLLKKAAANQWRTLAASALLMLAILLGTTYAFVEVNLARNAAIDAGRLADQKKDEVIAQKIELMAQKEEVEKERQVAQTVREFLQNNFIGQTSVWAQANLYSVGSESTGDAPRYDVSARELLDRAATQFSPTDISRKFPGQPEVQAAILETIGDAFEGRGDFSRAFEFANAAYEVRIEHCGATAPETLAANTRLVYVMLSAKQFTDSVAKITELIAVVDSLYNEGVDKTGIAHADAALGAVLDATRERLDPRRFIIPKPPVDIIGGTLTFFRIHASIPRLERLVRRAKTAFGDDSPRTVLIQLHLAFAYHATLNIQKAIDIYQDLLTSRALEPNQFEPERAYLHIALSIAYEHIPEAKELSEHHLREGAEAIIRTLGADHPGALNCFQQLAGLCLRSQDYSGAIVYLSQANEVAVNRLGPSHPLTMTIQLSLAQALLETGQPETALDVLRSLENLVGDGNTTSGSDESLKLAINIRHLLGLTNRLLKRPETAIEYLKWAYDRSNTNFGLHDNRTLSIGLEMARCSMNMNDLGVAEEWYLLVGSAVLKKRARVSMQGDVIGELCSCLEANGKHEEAQQWRRDWEALVERKNESSEANPKR